MRISEKAPYMDRHSPRAEVEESEAHKSFVALVVDGRRRGVAYGLGDFFLAFALDVPKPEDTRVVLVHLREHVVDFLDLTRVTWISRITSASSRRPRARRLQISHPCTV